MSSNFIPMLSSSPPPIDDAESPENDDDDDEFGMFAAADHGFDCSFDTLVASGNLSSENSSPRHNIHSENSSQKEKESHLKNSIQVNCSFKNTGISVFSIDKRKEHKLKPNHENSFRTDFQDELGDNELKSEISKSPNPYFARTIKQHFSNHSSFEDHAEISIESNHDDTSSQQFVPNSCNTAVPEPNSQSKTVERVLNNDSQMTDFEQFKDGVVFKERESPQYENHLDDASNSSEFCNFESVNISECMNGDVELQSLESEVLLSASNSKLYNNDATNRTTLDADCDSDHAPLSDVEKTHLVNEDHTPLERTDPPDKRTSMSCRRFSEDFDDFKFSTVVDDDGDDLQFENNIPLAVVSSKGSEGSDENFGDFESVNVPSFSALSTSDSVICKTNDDFTDFKSSELSDESSWKASDADFQSAEGFADFEDANSKTELQVPLSETVISKGATGGLEKITKVICAVFPLSKEDETTHESEIIFDTLEQNSKSRRLWDKLHDNDQTPGIPFQWGVSHSFQQLLRSVNVDYHSILRTSTVPFFASGLGLLEPTKGPGSKDNNNTHCSDSETGGSKDPIPPVHFDWGSSGLINPLDSVQVASTLMDLSFLTSSENSSCTETISKDFSLENELLKPESEIIKSIPATNPPILEQILSLNANSSVLTADSTSGSRPPNLSEEAIRVLDQLPDISFVRGKVLMFPISGNT